MSCGNRSLLRKLVPKSYHFDAYNELNCPNNRDRPFFEDGVISIGKYYLSKRLEDDDTLVLQYSSVCPNGHILFKPYRLTMETYIDMLLDASKKKSDCLLFDIPVRYDFDSNHCKYCSDKNVDCSHLLKDLSETKIAAVSFDQNDIKNALSVYYGITTPKHPSRGGKTMNNNFKKLLGMNLEFGISKDPNIAATFMGVAVKNPKTGDYLVYDPATKTLKNYSNLKFGDFRVFLLPDRTLMIDQLYKLDGKYYNVRAVDGNTATLVDAVDGTVIQKILSECLIPGMNFYTRVVALDPRTLFDPSSKTDMSQNILAAICMTQWSKGESEFSLDGIGDDSMNGLGMLLLMGAGGNNGLSNMMNGEGGMNLGTLLMLGAANDSDDSNGIIQYMLLSQIMGGGAPNATNLFGSVPGLAPMQPAAVPASDDVVVCPDCGEEYPVGTNFCSKCGTHTVAVEKGTYCTSCGTKLADGAAFCHNCGQKVVKDTCPNCNAKLPEDAKFCSVCGCNVTTGKASAPKTTKKATTCTKRTGVKAGTTASKGTTSRKTTATSTTKGKTETE